MKSKLHCVKVTEANLNYMGSITIDEDLMDAVNLIAGERVYIVNNNNGERFDTYVIKGERGSGCICLNGAAARKVQVVRLFAFSPTAKAAKSNCPLQPESVLNVFPSSTTHSPSDALIAGTSCGHLRPISGRSVQAMTVPSESITPSTVSVLSLNCKTIF